jgi:hypothetical protein
MAGPPRLKFSDLSPITKVAVSWAGWATVCLTGYYFARIWAGQQRIETLKIREVLNDEFSAKLTEARQSVEKNEKPR